MCESFDFWFDLTPVDMGTSSFHTSVTPESKWSELVGSMHVMHAAMASVRPSGDMTLISSDYASAPPGGIDMAKTQLATAKSADAQAAQEIITDQNQKSI